MLSTRVGWFLNCCSSKNDANSTVEYCHQLQSGENPGLHGQMRPQADSYAPRSSFVSDSGSDAIAPMTSRQRDIKDHLELPQLKEYPTPPDCGIDDDEKRRYQKLLSTYKEFTMDLHSGMILSQLTSNRGDVANIHCQLMEDLETLKMDQNNGRIIEFPLASVSKVYRIVKHGDKWYSAGSFNGSQPVPPLPLSSAEHIVVLEFRGRKLAFVFPGIQASQCFSICVELLVRRAQQAQSAANVGSVTKPMRPLPMAFPSTGSGLGKTCSGKRHVCESEPCNSCTRYL